MADFNIIETGQPWRVATGAAISTPGDVAQLVAAGVTHILDCRAEFDDQLLLVSSGVTYLWDPTADDGKPKPNTWWSKGLAFARAAINLATPVVIYAHCAAGVNRGPSMAYGILRGQGYTAATAEQAIRQVRPQVGLAYKADFERYLSELLAGKPGTEW